MDEQALNHSYRLDIDQLKYLVHKRFVEGISTMQLLQQATSEQEKEQIALVALLDVKEDLMVEFHYQQNGSHSWRLHEVRQVMLQTGILAEHMG